MGSAERRLGQQRAPGRQVSRDRVDRGDLQRGVGLQPGQHGGQAFGQHGLAYPRRPEQEQVVTAGRTDLGGPARRRLPDHVGQVQPALFGRPLQAHRLADIPPGGAACAGIPDVLEHDSVSSAPPGLREPDPGQRLSVSDAAECA